MSTEVSLATSLYDTWIVLTGQPTAWKIENVLTLALLKGLLLVHFFRGPLKELAKAISGKKMMAIQTTKGVTAAAHTP
jgi:hypothetical protein